MKAQADDLLDDYDEPIWLEITEAARDALYLLRPDSYVALADTSGAPAVLDRYFADRRIRPGPPTTSA